MGKQLFQLLVWAWLVWLAFCAYSLTVGLQSPPYWQAPKRIPLYGESAQHLMERVVPGDDDVPRRSGGELDAERIAERREERVFGATTLTVYHLLIAGAPGLVLWLARRLSTG